MDGKPVCTGSDPAAARSQTSAGLCVSLILTPTEHEQMKKTDGLEGTITVSNTVITRRSREQGFKALGAWITFDGHFVKEIAEREVIAWRSFHAIRLLLCDNKVALRHRLRLLSSCVASSMYWCLAAGF